MTEQEINEIQGIILNCFIQLYSNNVDNFEDNVDNGNFNFIKSALQKECISEGFLIDTYINDEMLKEFIEEFKNKNSSSFGSWAYPQNPWTSKGEQLGRPFTTQLHGTNDSSTSGFVRVGQPMDLYTYQNTPYGGDRYPEFLGPRAWMGGFGRNLSDSSLGFGRPKRKTATKKKTVAKRKMAMKKKTVAKGKKVMKKKTVAKGKNGDEEENSCKREKGDEEENGCKRESGEEEEDCEGG